MLRAVERILHSLHQARLRLPFIDTLAIFSLIYPNPHTHTPKQKNIKGLKVVRMGWKHAFKALY